MNEYLVTGGLPVPLPDDPVVLENMLRMHKLWDDKKEMTGPIERKLERLRQMSADGNKDGTTENTEDTE